MHLIAPNPFHGFTGSYKGSFKVPSPANLYYFLFQRALITVLKYKAALVLVSNQLDREFLLKKGLKPSNTMVTYVACDASFGADVINAAKSYDAVYVGRFHVQKGFPDLLQAWKKVTEHLPKALLVIIGEDITAGNIQEFISQNGLERNIRFLGFVGGAQKYEYIKSSKLCIFPSYYESFGMVALEAMACGVPVVAYDLPVFRGIYLKGMVRSEIGDVDAMAANVIRLLEHDGERSRIAGEALEMSRQFSWEKTASDILHDLEV